MQVASDSCSRTTEVILGVPIPTFSSVPVWPVSLPVHLLENTPGAKRTHLLLPEDPEQRDVPRSLPSLPLLRGCRLFFSLLCPSLREIPQQQPQTQVV